MDGTDGGGSMGGLHGDVGGGINGDMEARMENADGDSGEEVLQSMGYRDSEAGIDRTDGNSTGSWTSVLQTVVILTMAGFLGISFVYFLLTGILAIFGIHL